MPAPIPEPGPDEDQAPGRTPSPDTDEAAHADPGPDPGRLPAGAVGPDAVDQAREVRGGPGWAWVEGSADTGPVPLCERPGPQPWPADGDGLPAGLDYAALVEGLAASGALGSDADDQEAEFAEWQAAEAEGRLAPADPAQVAAQAVEHMPPGAAQAGWLEVAAAGIDRLDEYGLVGVTLAASRHNRFKTRANTLSSRKTCSISPAPGCRQRVISVSSTTPALPQRQATRVPGTRSRSRSERASAGQPVSGSRAVTASRSLARTSSTLAR